MITAELARKYAKATPREVSEPDNGVVAFDGKYVNMRSTTLVRV
jgi:hypothetical protein